MKKIETSLITRTGSLFHLQENGTKTTFKTKKIPIWLEPRSLIVLKGEARSAWLHGIVGRKSDQWEGETRKRQRRVSLTFRNVILKTEKNEK